MENNYNTDAKNESADKIGLLVKALTALRLITTEKELSAESRDALFSVPAFMEFFELPINSPEELEFKKRFASALILAKEEGALPFELPESPEGIALLVNEGLTIAKTAYWAGTGKLESEEAFDIIYDTVTVAAVRLIRIVVGVGFPFATRTIADALSSYFPKMKPVTDLIKKFLPHCSEKVAEGVARGLEKIADAAKPAVKKCFEALRGTVKRGVAIAKKAAELLKPLVSPNDVIIF